MKKTIILIILLTIVFFNSGAFASTVKFAQISDLHYQSNILRNNINYYSLLIIDEVAQEINKDKDIKFTLITGDIINKRKKMMQNLYSNILTRFLKILGILFLAIMI